MAKTSFEIECVDCGRPYTAIRKNAKYCRVCRLLRNVTYSGSLNYRKTCIGCEREYLPLTKESLSVCGDCNPNSFMHDAAGTCSFCNRETDKLLHEDVKVCRRCAQDPEQRDLFIKALLKKKAQRCAAE